MLALFNGNLVEVNHGDLVVHSLKNHTQAYIVILTAFMAVTALSPTARSCAIVTDSDHTVTTRTENVIIVYDPATKTQHFIRKAEFHSSAKDFGFLVPTPSMVELAEAETQAFDRLATTTAPKHVTKPRRVFHATLFEVMFPDALDSIYSNVDSSLPTGSSGESGVEVLRTQTVAGYEAAVLRADDPEALMKWLEENGYEFKSDLTEWIRPYIEKCWVITAFKYSGGTGTSATTLQTKAVRMSFETERPFFPYREPTGQAVSASEERLLKVYLISPSRMAGSLEDPRFDWTTNSKTAYAVQNPKMAALVKGAVPEGSVPDHAWLTVFEDRFARRLQGGDLYFAKSTSQQTVIPPPIIHYQGTVHIPLCADVMLVIFLYFQVRKAIAARLARANPRYALRH